MRASKRRLLCGLTLVLLGACDRDGPTSSGATPLVGAAISSRAVVVGTPVRIDLRNAFTDREGQGFTYSVAVTPATARWVSIAGNTVAGTPDAAAVVSVRVTAMDASGDSVSQTFSVVAFASGLTSPVLPVSLLGYSDTRRPIPPQYLLNSAPGGSASQLSNTPLTNPVTDAAATLGRVLFNDRRLSANDRVSCASCHLQQFGFSDTAQFSTGFAGEKTSRHSMTLVNSRFFPSGRFFWDMRAASLEEQTLMPIQNNVEMGLTLDQLFLKLRFTSYYPPLFEAAFGTTDMNTERVSRALAQYIRSIISYGSRFDSAFAPGAPGPDLTKLTAQEQAGRVLFNGSAGCARCHISNAHVNTGAQNTGLDATITDVGAGNGTFKSPSLRNAGLRGRYMHDGRFTSLEQVVDFYNSGVQPNPGLDFRLRGTGGAPQRLNLTVGQRDAIVAYLRTLTDPALLSDPRFGNPFAAPP